VNIRKMGGCWEKRWCEFANLLAEGFGRNSLHEELKSRKYHLISLPQTLIAERKNRAKLSGSEEKKRLSKCEKTSRPWGETGGTSLGY